MGYTVRQLVEGAFAEIGMAAYVFDLTPDMLDSAASRMAAMLADWNGKGIRIAAPIPSTPDGIDLDEVTAIPSVANTAIITNLAIEIAPSYGKQPAMGTIKRAMTSFNTLLSRAALPPEMQFPTTLPAGAGNKPTRTNSPFILPTVDPIDAGPDGVLEF